MTDACRPLPKYWAWYVRMCPLLRVYMWLHSHSIPNHQRYIWRKNVACSSCTSCGKDNGDGACTQIDGVALLRQYDMIQADTVIQPKVRSCCVYVCAEEGDNMETDGTLLLHIGVDTYHGRTTISCARR